MIKTYISDSYQDMIDALKEQAVLLDSMLNVSGEAKVLANLFDIDGFCGSYEIV